MSPLVRHRCAAALALLLSFAAPAQAFGPEGHKTVGAIADRLLAGTRAAAQVQALLGGIGLQQAALWADCAKGIDPARDYAYTSAGRFPECSVFETPASEAEMSDFVRRNDTNCPRKPTEESCHKQYHYTDVAIQRGRYAPGLAGTRDDDIVGAIRAAVAVLKGAPAVAPFAIKDKREALLLLAHYVGDIHQPLHVAAVYLDAAGRRVDPDAGTLDPATETRGGNQIITVDAFSQTRGPNFHRVWDNVPATLTVSRIGPAWLAQARAVPATRGSALGWSAAWASETVVRARPAFAGLRFGSKQADLWTVTLPAAYTTQMNDIKRTELTRAGARLAQVLRDVWP
jgi:hypothetical protein